MPRKSSGPSIPATAASGTRQQRLRALFDFFYPVHYKVGMMIESLLSGGRLTRKQFAVLWMIHSAGEAGRSIARKKLEMYLADWLEMRGPAISNVLKELSTPPLALVAVVNSPNSGRERIVQLTAAGRLFTARADALGMRFLSKLLADMSEETMQHGMNYLDEISRTFADEDKVQAVVGHLPRAARRKTRAASVPAASRET